MPNGNFHNSSPCIDCFNHFKELFHTIKYLVYTKKDLREDTGYSLEKIHFRDYTPTLTTSGRLYRDNAINEKNQKNE